MSYCSNTVQSKPVYQGQSSPVLKGASSLLAPGFSTETADSGKEVSLNDIIILPEKDLCDICIFN